MRGRWIRRIVLGMVLTAGAATVSAVPAGADDPPAAALDRFYHQKLDWRPCDHPALDAAGAQCAGVVVPLDYSRPDGRTTTVAISRIAATDPPGGAASCCRIRADRVVRGWP